MRGKRGISKALAAGIIVVIIVIVAIVISYYYLMPAPEPEPTPTPTPTPVSSLKFNVDLTYDEVTDTFTYYLKGIDADNITMRMEYTFAGEEYVVILNEEQEGWGDYEGTVSDYIDRLEGWTEGDVTYTYDDPTTGETAAKIYNIEVNPVLEDSLFEAES